MADTVHRQHLHKTIVQMLQQFFNLRTQEHSLFLFHCYV